MKKLEELRRRRGITGLIGCPSDTKDPDDWDWDNWDNWPQEDKDMFPIEEEEDLRRQRESVEGLPFMIFMEVENIGGGIYVIYGKDREGNCPSLWLQRDDNNEVFFSPVTLNAHDMEEDGEPLDSLDKSTIDYLRRLFSWNGYNPDVLGFQVDSFDDLKDISEGEFNKMAKLETRLDESLFVDRWQDTLELVPDCENVWFIADGKIYIGLYEPEQKIFCMADGLGVPLASVRQWKYITEKEVAGYPKEKQIIAVDIPDFPCPVTGIFSDHLVDEETGDEFSGVVLDEEYTFCQNGCDSVKWANVFAWYPIPEEPLNVIDVEGNIDLSGFSFEFDNTDAGINGDTIDDSESEPLPEINTEDSPIDSLDTIEDEIQGETEEIPAEVSAEGEEVGTPIENNEKGSAIAAANTENDNEDEEESLVKKESNELEGGRLTESEEALYNDKVREWYMKEYPTDDMGEDIDPEITFMDVFDALDNYEDVYEVFGVGDSIIRERIFTELAKRMEVDYDYIYDQWLKSADRIESKVDWSKIDPEWIEKLYKSGEYTADERDEAIENIRKALGGKSIFEAVEKKNPRVREARVYYDFPGDYRPWSGAVETWHVIEAADAMDDFERFLDEMYPDGIGETELNDLLWFDDDYVLESLGLKNQEDDEEDEDEDEEEEEELIPVSEEEYKGYDICEWYEDDEDPDPNQTYFTICKGNRSVGGVLPSKDAAKKKIDDGDLKESKSAIKAHKLNEAIRGNTKQFIQNVENYLEGFGDDIWETLRVNIQYLQENHSKYGLLSEAIKEYIMGGSLDVYYDQVRKTLNELYENTPEEVEKWANYPTDKLWERYINIMCLYIPKAYKKHTGKSLDMREDPESEYNQKMKVKYGERKLSIGDFLYERGLTKSERHNREMDKIFNFKKDIDNEQCQFLLDHGANADEVEDSRKKDKVDVLLSKMGLHDDFWRYYDIKKGKIQEHLENISDEAYGKWVKLKRKLDHEYLADYCLEALPKYEAELIIDYLADMNGIENGDLNQY